MEFIKFLLEWKGKWKIEFLIDLPFQKVMCLILFFRLFNKNEIPQEILENTTEAKLLTPQKF